MHLDLRDWKPFRQNIFGNFQKHSGVFGKSLEVAVTFSEIPVMTRRKSHIFDSEKVGRYKITTDQNQEKVKDTVSIQFYHHLNS